jgi:putative transposase
VKEDKDFRRGRHVVHNLHVHLVFVPKYRRRVISATVFGLLQSAFQTVCTDFGSVLEEIGYEDDHVHLLIGYPPKIALSTLVNSLKGISARLLRKADLPEIRSKLDGDHFWSPSYCVVSCGGAPLQIVKQYVEAQCGNKTSSPS